MSELEPIKVAIIGKPNVGKSSLFNRLVKKRKAIESPQPGITRDVNFEVIKLDSIPVRIADTGGISRSKEKISSKVNEINLNLIKESDIVIFLCDVHSLTIEDQHIAEQLRKLSKPTILAVNKVDNSDLESDVYDFYSLGFNRILPISVVHNRGIDQLKEELLNLIYEFYADRITGDESHIETREIKVAIVGRPNVGKSSILNTLLGRDRAIVSDTPGTTRDAIDEILDYRNYKIRFIDTAGIRKYRKIKESVEFYSLTRAQKAIKESDISILIIDAAEGITSQDKKISDLVVKEGKALILAVNKWDLMQDMNVRERDYFDQLDYKFPHIGFAYKITVSAKTGYNKLKLLNAIIKVYNNYTKRVKTSVLNSFLHGLSHHGLYIKYGYQKDTAPPIFEFFVNRSERVDENYRRFIANKLRKSIDFTGVPVNILIRSD